MKSKANLKSATDLYEVRFDGGILQRGFWLYVWEVTLPQGATLFYVGRTGDSSSTNAQSPFNRMGQHLGFAKNSSMLRRHLVRYGVVPERCSFRLVAVGPVLKESSAVVRHEHDARRDVVAAMEKALAEHMKAAGYEVMNTVKCRKTLDAARFSKMRTTFASAFPALVRPSGVAKKGKSQ